MKKIGIIFHFLILLLSLRSIAYCEEETIVFPKTKVRRYDPSSDKAPMPHAPIMVDGEVRDPDDFSHSRIAEYMSTYSGKSSEDSNQLSKEEKSFNSTVAYYRSQKASLEVAIAERTKQINNDPGSFTAYYERGYLNQRAGNLDAAISDLTKAINIYSRRYPKQSDYRFTDAYRERARTYYLKQEYDKAWEDIKYDQYAFSLDFYELLKKKIGKR